MEVDHQDAILRSKEQALIAKGKRTKRQRLHSPLPFALSTNSSSGDIGGFVDDVIDFVAENNHHIVNPDKNHNQYQNDATEEEEDMANCLILLAQGQPYCSAPREHVADTGRFHHHNNRRVSVENDVAVGGSGGWYGYECKTCYRTFPSFQALGGHRASHKKPKAMEVEKKMFLSTHDEEMQLKNNVTNSISMQLNQKGSNLYNNGYNKANKVHECAVCGAEFTSGQALGGHMRRHRALPVGTNTALSLTPTVVEPELDRRPPKRQRSVLSLDLDLNLPAPQEHDQRESKSLIKSNQQQQQQQQLVFPSRTLVDCHY